MGSYDDIISFDLFSGDPSPLDITGSFPVSDLHAIRSTKAIMDTILP